MNTLKPNLRELAQARVEQEEREWRLVKRIAAAVAIFTMIAIIAEAFFVFAIRGAQ